MKIQGCSGFERSGGSYYFLGYINYEATTSFANCFGYLFYESIRILILCKKYLTIIEYFHIMTSFCVSPKLSRLLLSSYFNQTKARGATNSGCGKESR